MTGEKVNQEIKKREDYIETLEKRAIFLSKDLQTKKEEVIELNKEIEKLKLEVQNLQSQTANSDSALIEAQNKLKEKQKQIEALEKQATDLKKEKNDLEDKIDELELKLKKLIREKGESDEKTKELQGKFNKLEGEKKEVENKLTENKAEQVKLREEIRKLNSEISNLEETKNSELNKITLENSQFSRDLQEKEDLIKKLKSDLEESKKRAQIAEKENKNFLTEIEQAKKDLKAANEQLNSNQTNQQETDDLKTKVKDLTKQLLNIKLFELNNRITSLTSLLNVNGTNISAKFSKEGKDSDYRNALTNEATLENIELLEQTLRIIIGICSVERAEATSNVLKRQQRPNTAAVISLKETLKTNSENWEEINSHSIKVIKEDNPLYLNIIERKEHYEELTKNLIEEWKNKGSTRGIDLRIGIELDDWNIKLVQRYKNLVSTKTTFGIFDSVKNGNIAREKTQEYFNWIKSEYPELENEINERYKAKENQFERFFRMNQLLQFNSQSFKAFIQRFLEDPLLISKFGEAAGEKIDELFKTNNTSLGFEKIDESKISDLKHSLSSQVIMNYGVDDILFLVNVLYKEIYFGYLPRKFKEYMEGTPSVEFSELDISAWNDGINELFSDFSDKLTNAGEEADLDLFEKYTNINSRRLVEIIKKVKDSKEIVVTNLCNDPSHSNTSEEAKQKVIKHLEEVEETWSKLKDNEDIFFKEWDKDNKSDKILYLIDKALRKGKSGSLENFNLLEEEWTKIVGGDHVGEQATFINLLAEWKKAIVRQGDSNKFKELVEDILGPKYLSLIEKQE